jgi:hypothetical protein
MRKPVAMLSADASDAVRAVALDFGAGMASVIDMWTAFQEHLFDMCADAPLSGVFLDLFTALERWEASVGAASEKAIADARAIARQFTADA